MNKNWHKAKLLVTGAAFILSTSCFAGPVLAGPADMGISGSDPVKDWVDQSGNTISWGVGGVVDSGATNNANGNVGTFSGHYDVKNSIDSAVGAEVGSGTKNTAQGNVGKFTNSSDNHIRNVTIDGKTYDTVGAVVGSGIGNSAVGDVGTFKNHRYGDISNNTIYASIGAEVDGGGTVIKGKYDGNDAKGKVGIFTASGGTIEGNTINQFSRGALVVVESTNGYNNVAKGNVGTFTADCGGLVTNNKIGANSEGAYIDIGSSGDKANKNRATGSVGTFTAGCGSWVDNNTVTGDGAQIVTAGSNNQARGSVGTFAAGVGSIFKDNQVTGIGAEVLGGNNNKATGTVGQFNVKVK